jgi:uncharacterized protein YhfF
MLVPANVEAMWSAYARSVGGVDEARFYEAFHFGDSAALADELGQLVLSIPTPRAGQAFMKKHYFWL